MFNIDTGLILNINYIKSINNVTILTSNYGVKIVSLPEIKINLNKYSLLDCWNFGRLSKIRNKLNLYSLIIF